MNEIQQNQRIDTLISFNFLNFYLLKVCCGIKPINRYFVTDGTGNKVFSILEDSECCDRYCCGGGHPFTMNVTDNSNLNVIRLVHPSACCCGSQEVWMFFLSCLTVKYVMWMNYVYIMCCIYILAGGSVSTRHCHWIYSTKLALLPI